MEKKVDEAMGMELVQLLGLPDSLASDPSAAPLSAPDLHSLINRMHIRSEQVKDRVRRCITSQHQEFALTISRATTSLAQLGTISNELDSLLLRFNAIAPPGKLPTDSLRTVQQTTDVSSFYLELCDLVEEARKATKEAKDKRKALVVVEWISRLQDKLTSATKEFREGDFLKAAQKLLDVRSAIGCSIDREEEDDALGDEARAYNFLRHVWVDIFSQMSLSLGELFDKAVVLDEMDSKLYVHAFLNGEQGVSSSGAQLTTILTAMDKIGVLEAAFAKFADKLLKSVIGVILQDPFKKDISEEGSTMGKVVLLWSCRSTSEDGQVLGLLYSKLLRVVGFLHQHLCCNHEPWIKELGRFVWPRMADAIISGYLSKAVPDEASEVARFQELADLTNEFETALSRLNFIPKQHGDSDRLGKFASDVELHFASKKKSRVLARTRRLLVRSDFNVCSRGKRNEQGSTDIYKVSKENSVELLTQCEKCVISHAAKQLMQIVHEVLQDACLAASRISVELCDTARDALLLYSAIVPVKLARELHSISQEAIIYHNDCLYLAHEILGLSYQYRETLPVNLRERFVVVDLSLLFQGIAADTLEQQLDIIKSSLDQALDQGNGFQNTNKIQAYEMASLAIDQVVFVLEKVRMIWQPVMGSNLYTKSMGSLMNSVFERLASEILNLDDMDMKETEQLRMLVFSLEERLLPMLQSLVISAPENQKRANRRYQDPLNQIGELVPSWCKLLRLAELLDMSLIAITQAWESGNLSVCGFSSFEVHKLIMAVFSDTGLRKESLQRIAAKQFSKDGKGS